MSNETRKLQSSISRYASIAVVLVSFVVSVSIIWPMTKRFKAYEEQGLAFARDTAVLVLSDYIEHLSEVSQILGNHYQISGVINPKVLSADMHTDDDLVGISLMVEGQAKQNVGKEFVDKLQDIEKKSINSQKIVGPFYQDHHYFVYVVTPLTASHTRLYTLFELTHLEEHLHKKLRASFGQVIVAYLNQNHIEIFSPQDQKWQKEAQALNNALVQSLREAIGGSVTGTMGGKVLGRRAVISFSPVRNSEWGVAVIVNQDHFYSTMKRLVSYLCFITLIITLLVLLGLQFVLSPLSGKLIMHNDVLETKISDAKVELMKVNAKLEHAALFDSLTDVLNRRGLEEQVGPIFSRLKRQNGRLLLFYIDVNRFKEINDNLGHEAGDEVLKQTALRLRENLRTEDVVARLGGDEFLVLAVDVKTETSQTIIQKLKEACARPINFHQQAIKTSISVGCARYSEDGEDYLSLIKVADQRMYEDKRKDNYQRL